MTEKTNTKRPSHALYMVQGEGDKARWTRIGSAWPNKSGKGMNLVFDAVPLSGRVQMQTITEKTTDGQKPEEGGDE